MKRKLIIEEFDNGHFKIKFQKNFMLFWFIKTNIIIDSYIFYWVTNIVNGEPICWPMDYLFSSKLEAEEFIQKYESEIEFDGHINYNSIKNEDNHLILL